MGDVTLNSVTLVVRIDCKEAIVEPHTHIHTERRRNKSTSKLKDPYHYLIGFKRMKRHPYKTNLLQRASPVAE